MVEELLDIEGRPLGHVTLPTSTPTVPARVWLADGQLHYSMLPGAERAARPKAATNLQGMLDAFRRIRDEQGVPHFAKRYGVMELCEEHSFPTPHNPPRDGYAGCRIAGSYSDQFEPAEAWLTFARAVDAFVRLVSETGKGRPGNEEEWTILTEMFPTIRDWVELSSGSDQPADPLLRRRALETILSWWIQWGDVRPRLHWIRAAQPRFELGARNTFGTIAMQLMLLVGRARDLALCTGCGDAYLRKGRRPQGTYRNYCPKCVRTGKPARDRQQAHREKLKAGAN